MNHQVWGYVDGQVVCAFSNASNRFVELCYSHHKGKHSERDEAILLRFCECLARHPDPFQPAD